MAFAAATTAGSANSRATIAVCDNTLPVSATIAPARRNTIIQAADVVGHTNTSPARSVCSWSAVAESSFA